MYKIVKGFMMKRRKGKNLAIGILCCMLVFIGIGYAALSQVLKVTTTGNVTGQWKIYIDSADLNTETETDTNKIIDTTKATSSITDRINATINVSFNEPGEYALYDIVVKNAGNIDAELKNINLTTEANLDNFDVETIGLGTGTKNLKSNPTFSGVNLLANNGLSFQLKITFDKDKDLTELPSPDTEYKFTISMNYAQKTSNTSGGDGGTTDDPNAPDFTVDDTGKIVAYNSSKITENDGYVVIPAANSEGKAITSIDRSSFAKSNITMVYDYDECYIDAATEEEYLELKAKVEELMNEDGSGSFSGSGSGSSSGSYSSGSSSMAVKNLKPEIKRLNTLVSPDVVKVSGSGSGSGSGSMTIYWTKEKEIPTDAEDVERGYLNLETGEVEDSVSRFEKIDLTQATSLEEIGYETFSASPLTSIKFNEGLKRIGENAFGSSELSGSIELPNSLESIGDYAFSYCQLTSVKLPSNLNEIGNSAFSNNQISALELPNGLTTIGESAFSSNQIATLELPNGLTTIGESAFSSNRIATLVIPSSVTTIGNYAFGGNQLTEITVPSTVKSLGSGAFSGITKLTIGMETISDYAFNWSSLNELVILNTVKSIGNEAFSHNQLTNVQFSEGLTTIGDRAFAENQITSIQFPDGLTTIGEGAFSLNAISNVQFSEGLISIGNNAFSDNSISTLIFPSTLTTIGEYAFEGNNLLTSVEISASVTTIGDNAFSGTGIYSPVTVNILGDDSRFDDRWIQIGFSKSSRPALCLLKSEIDNGWEITGYDSDCSTPENLTIPTKLEGKYITSIGSFALYNKSFKKVVFQNTKENPSHLISIGNAAFRENKLTEIEVPASVQIIEDSAFESNQLTEITIPSSVQTIGGFGDNQIKSLELPTNVTAVEDSAFSNNQITDLTIMNASISQSAFQNNPITKVVIGTKNIPMGAFYYINSIASLTLLNTVQTIGESAFRKNKLIEIEIPASVQTIENYAFSGNQISKLTIENTSNNPSQLKTLSGFGNNQLANVTIPNSVTTIGESAFSSNRLKEINIPNTVTSVGSYAFSGNQITSFELPTSMTSIVEGLFYNNKITSLVISSRISSIGSSAFGNNDISSLVFEGSNDDTSNLSSIGGRAFFSDNSLENISLDVVIPSSVTSIGANAFGKLNNLVINDCTVLCSSDATNNSAFYGINSLEIKKGNLVSEYMFQNKGIKKLSLQNVTEIGRNIFSGNQISGKLEIPEGATEIGSNAFGGNLIEELIIPYTVQRIGDASFEFNQLNNVIFEDSDLHPSRLTRVDFNSFWGNRLTSINIPKNLTAIDDGVFRQNLIESIEIPASVQTIVNSAFENNQISSLTFENTEEKPSQLKTLSGFNNNQLTNVTIPNSVTTIEDDAFSSNQISKLTIENTEEKPSQLKEISGFANNQLAEVVIPANVQTIAYHTFYNNKLTSLIFENPSNLAKIGSSAFQSNKLKTVIIPNSVTTIGASAFNENPNLTIITIKRSDSIGMTLENNWNGSATVVYDPS